MPRLRKKLSQVAVYADYLVESLVGEEAEAFEPIRPHDPVTKAIPMISLV
jgi:hypothetical protein